MTAIATVTDLFVYPLKSARGIACPRLRLGATGFEADRQWMLVNAHGVFLSQRTHPQLACIVPEFDADELVLHAPGLPPLRLPCRCSGERLAVRVHDSGAHELCGRLPGARL